MEGDDGRRVFENVRGKNSKWVVVQNRPGLFPVLNSSLELDVTWRKAGWSHVDLCLHSLSVKSAVDLINSLTFDCVSFPRCWKVHHRRPDHVSSLLCSRWAAVVGHQGLAMTPPVSARYLTGMVDKRTLEKYEREAKEKNRETWWVAADPDQKCCWLNKAFLFGWMLYVKGNRDSVMVKLLCRELTLLWSTVCLQVSVLGFGHQPRGEGQGEDGGGGPGVLWDRQEALYYLRCSRP